ncbi:MAG: CDP-alcohol phosphatidyltransferase family protein [Bacteroidales bacterium]|nr:CDP-alcohol phosphatidyltransferase family protein [Bacteroidales bacterium]
MTNNKADAVRIQTSVLNAAEKKVLVWLAERQPKWMTSDILTYIGTFGAIVIAAGYILSTRNINFLWLSSLGFIINWYGDSLDGTLARVRKMQRPIYGYYIDHTVDAINEVMIFVGVGLSGLMHLEIALMALVMYFLITINVSINAHLKKEFKLTYAKMGPTEFRILMIIINTLFALIRPLRDFSHSFILFGHELTFEALDYIGVVIIIILVILHLTTVINDMKGYAEIDPMPRKE